MITDSRFKNFIGITLKDARFTDVTQEKYKHTNYTTKNINTQWYTLDNADKFLCLNPIILSLWIYRRDVFTTIRYSFWWTMCVLHFYLTTFNMYVSRNARSILSDCDMVFCLRKWKSMRLEACKILKRTRHSDVAEVQQIRVQQIRECNKSGIERETMAITSHQ